MKQTIAKSIIFVSLVFTVIAGKFTYIQIFQADELQESTVEQRVRKIKEMPDRGEIKDSEGRTLAMSLNAKNIAVYPNIMKSDKTKKNISKLLSETLELPYDEVLKKVNTEDEDGNSPQWVSIANRVDPEMAEKLKNSDYSGYIEISNAPKRYYPNGNLGSTFLGFVNHQSEPGSGLELSLNHYLGGISGYRIAEFDTTKKEIPIGFETASEPVSGNQVTLTIDSYIQYTLEETLKNAVETMNPEAIHTIVMDPNTGKILGMASYPSYDPNKYTEAEQKVINMNPASYVYEPGSTFKPIYLAAALDAGHITKDFTYYDGGTINVNGTQLRNWDSRGLGQANLEDIIVNSSNVGMINVSKQMTSEETFEALKKSGIGQKTGIELINEEIGLIPSAKTLENDPLVKATVSFGQGISITPIQLITSFSEIINGGYNIKPTLLEKVEDNSGNIKYQFTESKKERVYKQETSDAIRGYLKANMEIGSGKSVAIDGYDGGGKTGSAWKVENNVYAQGKIIGSFIGFIPYDNPKYVLLAVVDDPKGAEFGSTSGGPIFKEALTEIVRYKGEPKTIPLKGEEEIEKEVKINIPDVTYELLDNAKKEIEKTVDMDVKFNQIGFGEVVVSQDYQIKDNVLTVNLKTVNIKGSGDTIYIPNLSGSTKKEVEELFKRYNIELRIHGQGNVKFQETEPGEYRQKIKNLTLWFD